MGNHNNKYYIDYINYSFNYNAQQVREIGSFEYIKDRNALNSRIPIISQPSVTLNFSYFLYDAFNESQMGFNIGSEGIFGGTSTLYKFPDFTNDPGAIAQKGDVNFFVLAEPSSWRKDIVGRKEAFPFQGLDLIGLGNCYLTSYNLSEIPHTGPFAPTLFGPDRRQLLYDKYIRYLEEK